MALLDFWLPVLVAAVAAHFLSFIIHMVLTYHRSNVGQIPNEDQFRQAVRTLDIPQGEYMFPWGDGPEALKSEAYLKKLNEGPVGLLTIMPNGPWPMAKSLTQWFVYLVLVNIFVAYVAGLALTDTSDAMAIFRLATTVAFSGYGLALIQNSIWWARKWSTTLKFLFDALLYSLATGAIFTWLWPLS